jgi:hypothetical protein
VTVRRRTAVGALAGVLVALAAATPARGQTVDTRPLLGVGVSFLYDNEDDSATGAAVDVVQNFAVRSWLAIGAVGDFGIHRYSDGIVDINVTSFMGGVRFTSFAGNRVQPFGQVLAGAERCCGSTDFAWQPGGGVDLVASAVVNLRAQVDFRIVRFEGQSFNETRFTFGISVPIGN